MNSSIIVHLCLKIVTKQAASCKFNRIDSLSEVSVLKPEPKPSRPHATGSRRKGTPEYFAAHTRREHQGSLRSQHLRSKRQKTDRHVANAHVLSQPQFHPVGQRISHIK